MEHATAVVGAEPLLKTSCRIAGAGYFDDCHRPLHTYSGNAKRLLKIRCPACAADGIPAAWRIPAFSAIIG